MRPLVGVLALQGDFAAHAACLVRAGAEAVEVRLPADLAGCRGLLIPGGESTTLWRLMDPHRWDEVIRGFHRGGGALFGTCAGAIVLARNVRPAQRSVGLIDLVAERNAYGRQRQSFEGTALPTAAFSGPDRSPLPMLFIRAPHLLDPGPGVEILATWRDQIVLARQGRVLVASGHPELTDDLRVHRLFLEIVAQTNQSTEVPGEARIPISIT